MWILSIGRIRKLGVGVSVSVSVGVGVGVGVKCESEVHGYSRGGEPFPSQCVKIRYFCIHLFW